MELMRPSDLGHVPSMDEPAAVAVMMVDSFGESRNGDDPKKRDGSGHPIIPL